MATQSALTFKTKLLQAGKTATGIEFPAKIVDALGAGKRPPVRVTLNGLHLSQHNGGDGRQIHGRRER
ncbi:MAG: DUF1905 domain-containing protein [Steroidobacteraceae bacterium]